MPFAGQKSCDGGNFGGILPGFLGGSLAYPLISQTPLSSRQATVSNPLVRLPAT